YWVVHCHAAAVDIDCTDASSWKGNENRLTVDSSGVGAPFNMRTAPYAAGYFTGDYEGLDNFGTTFTPFFVQATGSDPFHQLTDAFYSTAGP
ncbi:MAG TPA: hypothetical protein VII47_06175, partial [Actinomycetota bacterium]